jgi:uncharacterized repeat protein (TIGR01451 family)
MATLAIGTETVPADLVIGQTFSYVIHVVNLGPDAAANVVITDLVSDLVDPGPTTGTCSRQGRVVTCPVGTIEPGGQRTVSFFASPNSPAGPILNAASVRGTNTNVATVLHMTFAKRPPNLVQYYTPQ